MIKGRHTRRSRLRSKSRVKGGSMAGRLAVPASLLLLQKILHSKKHHKILSKVINNTDIDKVYVYGDLIQETFKNLKSIKKGKILKNKVDIKKLFIENIKNKDLVMIKGSNATGLFKITQDLKKGKINAI